MKTILAIPSGNRVKKLLKCIEKWRKVCDFNIALYTWDEETKNAAEGLVEYFFQGPMGSFAGNHNLMAASIKDWDIYICGADDLYPNNGISKIPVVCKENPGKVIWAKDGLWNEQPTHPIITRGWYDKHRYIFDEDYRHNFCDMDLFVRLINAGEVVKCFDIGFDHRHYTKTGEKLDEIYKIGLQTFVKDKLIFSKKHPLPITSRNVPEMKV